MRAAAAEMMIQLGSNLGAARQMIQTPQPGIGCDQDATEAVTALRCLMLQESLDQGPPQSVIVQCLRRADSAACHVSSIQLAGMARHVIHQHHAGATLFQATAEASRRQTQMVAQGFQQRDA